MSIEPDSDHPGPIGSTTSVGPSIPGDEDTVEVPSVAPGPSGGWYPDPWNPAQHRYWSGRAWTADTFPHGPEPASRPLPPAWAPPQPAPGWGSQAREPVAPVAAGTRESRRSLAVIALIVGLVVGFVLAFAAGEVTRHPRSTSSPTADPTTGAGPSSTVLNPSSPSSGSSPADPAASALAGLVVGQADVGSDLTVRPLPGGDLVAGQVTLDLCNGSYPSEAERTARLQVVAVDAQGHAPLSTEAVLYTNPGATAQAFTELRAAAAACPPRPVSGPDGTSVTTHFNPAPDGSWPATASVERLAFDFTSTDQSGQPVHSVAVYLRRGRVLEGLYFSAPDSPQPAVAGQTTIPGIVGVFAERIAKLPASVVNG